MEEKNESKKSRKGLIIVLVLIVLLLLGVIGYLLFRGQAAPGTIGQEQTQEGPELELDKSQGEYVERETAPPDDSGVDPAVSVTLPGWGSLTIPANTTTIDRGIDFYNPERNKGYYYLTFQLNIDEDGDGEYETKLYESGLVEPAMHIQTIEIAKPLAPGTYNAQVFMQPYRMDEEKTPTNNGAITIPLIAEE